MIPELVLMIETSALSQYETQHVAPLLPKKSKRNKLDQSYIDIIVKYEIKNLSLGNFPNPPPIYPCLILQLRSFIYLQVPIIVHSFVRHYLLDPLPIRSILLLFLMVFLFCKDLDPSI